MDKKTKMTNTKLEKQIVEYKNQMSNEEKKALEIAINHLQSSFTIEKSIGFINYIEKRTK
jgi:hypothetical protein